MAVAVESVVQSAGAAVKSGRSVMNLTHNSWNSLKSTSVACYNNSHLGNYHRHFLPFPFLFTLNLSTLWIQLGPWRNGVHDSQDFKRYYLIFAQPWNYTETTFGYWQIIWNCNVVQLTQHRSMPVLLSAIHHGFSVGYNVKVAVFFLHDQLMFHISRTFWRIISDTLHWLFNDFHVQDIKLISLADGICKVTANSQSLWIAWRLMNNWFCNEILWSVCRSSTTQTNHPSLRL
jgi:hypothetical protein